MRHNPLSKANYLVAGFCLLTTVPAVPAQTESWFAAISVAQEHKRQGRYAEAETALLDTLKQAERSGPEELLVTTLNNLGSLCLDLDRYREAGQYFRRAISVLEKTAGARDPTLLWPLTNLAFLCVRNGQYEKAEQFYRRAQTLPVELLGPYETPIKAKLLQIQGTIEGHRGDHSKAEALGRQAVGLLEQYWGPKHHEVASAWNNLGILCRNRGDYAQAVSHFQRALAIWQATPNPDYSSLTTTLSNLGEVYHNLGLLSDAEAAFDKALKVAERAFGPQDVKIGRILSMYVPLLKAAKRNSQAKRFEKRAKTILAKQDTDGWMEHTVDVHTLLQGK